MTEPQLESELTRRFLTIIVASVVGFAVLVIAAYAITSEIQLRNSLGHSADAIESLLGLYADPSGEPTTVAPAMLAEQLVGMGQRFLITREVGEKDMRKVYFLSPNMPAKQLEAVVPASPDRVRALLLHEIADRARWRYRVLHRAVGDFDVYVLASRAPVLAGVAALSIAALALTPITVSLARRFSRRSVRILVGPVRSIADNTNKIGPDELDYRLPTPTGQADATALADAINRMLDRVQAAHRQLQGFTADASHELRTPLTHLRAQVQWALSDGRTSDEIHESLEAIEGELERTTKIVEDLLLIARGESGQLTLERRPFEVTDLVEDVRETAVAMGGSHQLDIRVEPNGGGRLLGDSTRARHALLNLVSNAVRYAHPSSENADAPGCITIAVRWDGQRCGIDVRDTGPGIPSDQQAKIFERFHRIDTSRSRAHGGAGLGLTIARLLARLQGGDITVRSAEGAGSTFTLWLPRYREASDPTKTPV